MRVFKYIIIIALIIVLAYTTYYVRYHIFSSYIDTRDYFSGEKDTLTAQIRRYPIPRELIWSGIPPFFGGTIPDPHIFRSSISEFTCGAKPCRIQIFEINPFFIDASYREVFMAIDRGNEIFHVPLENITLVNRAFLEPTPLLSSGNVSYLCYGKTVHSREIPVLERPYGVIYAISYNEGGISVKPIFRTDKILWEQTVQKIRSQKIMDSGLEALRQSRSRTAVKFLRELID